MHSSNFKDSFPNYVVHKYISITLILSFICSCCGCYRSILLKEEDEIRSYLTEKPRINYLTTQNAERYSFHNHRYQLMNDTLIGSAKQISTNPWQKYKRVKFSVAEIDSMEIQENNPVAIIAVSGVLVAGFIIFVATTINPW